MTRDDKDPMQPPGPKRCGARTRGGHPCRAWGMSNGRCRMHGGRSTGPRTAEGLARLRAARTRTGLHSAEMVAWRRTVAALLRSRRNARQREE